MKRALIGAGGFAREIKAHIGDETMKCFVDDLFWKENNNFIFPLSQFDPNEYEVIVAIGNPRDRYDIIQRLPKETKYFSFIHPSTQILGNDVKIGKGSIVCAGCILTTNIIIGDHAHLNLQTTIGHDCVIGDYFTTAPGVKISGNCKIYSCVYVGTNASIKEKISIHSFVTIGLNAGVVKDIEDTGIYVGTPAKKIQQYGK
jgi:sugar O-acyltransferase (sialic acid O-acetyltransferase NeuD family)